MADNDDVFVSEIRGWIEKWEFTEEDVNRVIEVVNKLPTPEEKRKYIVESEAEARKNGLKPKYQEVPTPEFTKFLESQNMTAQDFIDASQEKQEQLISSFGEHSPKISALKEASSTTFSDHQEEDTNSSQNSDWREMRRKAWKEYADTNKQPFEEISKAEDADLSMKVGDTPIHYQDKSHLTMGNGEYEKFVKAVQIEKADKTDIINFGNIQSEEYKQKLAAACIQEDMLMKNGPKSIDLNLECFKDLKPEVKAKIEEYNRTQAAKEAAKSQEKPQEKTETGNSNKENQTKSGEENQTDAPNPTNDGQGAETGTSGASAGSEKQDEQKPNYEEIFKKKVEDLKKEKEKNPDYKLDMSQIENTADRVIAFAAARTAGVKIDKLELQDSLRGNDASTREEADKIIDDVKKGLPKGAQNSVKAHEEVAAGYRRLEVKKQSNNEQKGTSKDSQDPKTPQKKNDSKTSGTLTVEQVIKGQGNSY